MEDKWELGVGILEKPEKVSGEEDWNTGGVWTANSTGTNYQRKEVWPDLKCLRLFKDSIYILLFFLSCIVAVYTLTQVFQQNRVYLITLALFVCLSTLTFFDSVVNFCFSWEKGRSPKNNHYEGLWEVIFMRDRSLHIVLETSRLATHTIRPQRNCTGHNSTTKACVLNKPMLITGLIQLIWFCCSLYYLLSSGIDFPT